MPKPVAKNTPPQRPTTDKPCGHVRHVGTCSTCQRVQLERWEAQLAQADPGRVRARA